MFKLLSDGCLKYHWWISGLAWYELGSHWQNLIIGKLPCAFYTLSCLQHSLVG